MTSMECLIFPLTSGWWWLEHVLWLSMKSWECHHPNWLIFFRGVGIPLTNYNYIFLIANIIWYYRDILDGGHGGFKHDLFFFHFIYGILILPIDGLHHFSRWSIKTTNQIMNLTIINHIITININHILTVYINHNGRSTTNQLTHIGDRFLSQNTEVTGRTSILCRAEPRPWRTMPWSAWKPWRGRTVRRNHWHFWVLPWRNDDFFGGNFMGIFVEMEISPDLVRFYWELAKVANVTFSSCWVDDRYIVNGWSTTFVFFLKRSWLEKNMG